ncbi:MAG: dTDP-4-dehydrorhamnose reductase, partial [Acidobacteriota bacterium]|nr:dTDP-4-dehydrorhamnose reductase [Acidobacteriota bacterium]
MRVLVTGAAGQLGRVLVRALADHAVTGLAREQLDITSPGEIDKAIETTRPEILINAAAYTDVDGAEGDDRSALLANAKGPERLARATASIGIPMVQLSTDYVFDGERDRPYTEYDPTGPISVYGRSKLAGEDAVRASNPKHYIVRTAWLYAVEGSNFPNTMRTLAGRNDVRVVDDQKGSPTYAPHLAEAIKRLIATGKFGTYHIAGRGGATRYELACALFETLGSNTRVVPVPTSAMPRPAPRPRYSVLETAAEPRILLPPWHEGLRAFAGALAHADRQTGSSEGSSSSGRS